MIQCSLCQETVYSVFWSQSGELKPIDFYACPQCFLIFKDPVAFPNPEEEKKRYLSHRNDPDNPDYRNFLGRLIDTFKERLTPTMKGLDYGCGPTTAISIMLREQGYECAAYDPYFFPQTELLQKKYDFVTCSEVAEHFHHPSQEFARLFDLLKDNGWLALMTQPPPLDFPNWWYHRDPTHVCFYSDKTLRWIAQKYQATPHFFPHGVTLLHKKGLWV